MHSAAMGSRVTISWAQVRTKTLSARFVRLTELRKLKQCEQVAALCYRMRGGSIEFLLVQTRKGRWIFPKGNAEPGLTHAQAAALEAFEEAGVHGRMEEASFTRYTRRERSEARGSGTESSVIVHLCEVLRLVAPQESDRNPTWFSANKAKRRLQEDRTPEFGAELARVLDRAVSRIQRPRGKAGSARAQQVRNSQKVQFIDIARVQETARETAGQSDRPRTG